MRIRFSILLLVFSFGSGPAASESMGHYAAPDSGPVYQSGKCILKIASARAGRREVSRWFCVARGLGRLIVGSSNSKFVGRCVDDGYDGNSFHTLGFAAMGETTAALQSTQSRESRRAEMNANIKRAQEQRAFLNKFNSEEPTPDHPLAEYGYYNARLIGEEPGVYLYVAAKTERDKRLEFVMVHEVEASATIFDTAPPDSQQVITPAPSFYAQLQRLIGETPLVQQRVLHHYANYHHPKDDRLRVLGPRYSETPIFRSQFQGSYPGGELLVSEHQTYPGIGWNTPTQLPLVTLERVIDRFGPSAPVAGDPNSDNLEPLKPEGPSDSYLAKERAVRDKALKLGLIYKNDSYWSAIASADLRDIFHGFDSGYGMRGYVGSTALMRYLDRNSKECRSGIADPKRFKLEEVTTEVDEYGNSSSYKTTIWDMVVPARFAPILDEKYGKSGDAGAREAVSQVWSLLRPGGLEQAASALKSTADLVQSTKDGVDKILAEGGCNNPLKQQLEEMLYQLSLGQSPVEKTTLRFADAATLSDPLYRRGESTTVTESCLAASDFTTDRRTRAYCACVDRYIQERAPDRVGVYSKRYRQLSRDFQIARTAMERGQDHPDIRVFGAMRATCVVR